MLSSYTGLTSQRECRSSPPGKAQVGGRRPCLPTRLPTPPQAPVLRGGRQARAAGPGMWKSTRRRPVSPCSPAMLGSTARLSTRSLPPTLTSTPSHPPCQGLPPSSLSGQPGPWRLPCPRLPPHISTPRPPPQAHSRPGPACILTSASDPCRGAAGALLAGDDPRASGPLASQQPLQARTMEQGAVVSPAPGLEPERKSGEPRAALGTGSGLPGQHSCGEGGQALLWDKLFITKCYK